MDASSRKKRAAESPADPELTPAPILVSTQLEERFNTLLAWNARRVPTDFLFSSEFEFLSATSSSFKFASIPSAKIRVSVGNRQFVPEFEPVALPKPLSSLLRTFYGQIHSEAHTIASLNLRLSKNRHAHEAGQPFGKFVVKAPDDDGMLYAASPEALLAFQTAVREANAKYIAAVHSAAHAAYSSSLSACLASITSLFDKQHLEVADLVSKILQSAPVFDVRIIARFLAIWELCWRDFNIVLNQKWSNLVELDSARAVKRVMAANIVQQAKDDLMDVELSHSTLKEIIVEEVAKAVKQKTPPQSQKAKPPQSQKAKPPQSQKAKSEQARSPTKQKHQQMQGKAAGNAKPSQSPQAGKSQVGRGKQTPPRSPRGRSKSKSKSRSRTHSGSKTSGKK